MPLQRPPGPLSVLVGALAAAGLILAAAGCSNVTPLGPEPSPVSLPPARPLGSPISVQVMRSQPPTPTGRCPAGSVALYGSEPNVPRAAVATSRPVPVGAGSTAAAPPATPSAAAAGRSVLPSGRNSGNDHFGSGLPGHHQPEPAGARLVRIRGRLSRRRRAGADRGHPSGL